MLLKIKIKKRKKIRQGFIVFEVYSVTVFTHTLMLLHIHTIFPFFLSDKAGIHMN